MLSPRSRIVQQQPSEGREEVKINETYQVCEMNHHINSNSSVEHSSQFNRLDINHMNQDVGYATIQAINEEVTSFRGIKNHLSQNKLAKGENTNTHETHHLN